jgi:hypothetical protein
VSSASEPLVNQRLQFVADELRAWNGVAIIGAGTSITAGLPLTQNLDSLLWQAVDSDDSALNRLAEHLQCNPTKAKKMIGDDDYARRSAFDIVSTNARAREVFQRGFSLLDQERTRAHSKAHDALVRLLHRRHLETIISFNWDTLLEAAYRRTYGGVLVADNAWLWKPHGDAAHPEARWVFPTESGVVPQELLSYLRSLAAVRPRILLIVGYSERDDLIVRQIIEPLSDHWRVVRVGPQATSDQDIPLPADEALPELLRRLNHRPEAPGWEYISFQPHNDLRPAVLGRRLGPNEVEVCPSLPEVSEVKRLLDLAHSAILVGESGSGKSITAYQAAYEFSKEGFELLRLISPDGDSDVILTSLTNLPRPTIAMIDDAQAVDPALIRRLLERSTANLKVLIVSISDYPFQRGSVTLEGARAVKVLAEHMIKHRQDALEIVGQLDDHVGDAYLQIRIEERIAEASKSDTPWQFSFVLTGGWRRARNLLEGLRKYERADHLLIVVAVYQILSRDAGATLGQLKSSVHLLGLHDPEWLDRALDRLRMERLILGDHYLRCPQSR